MNKYFNNNGFGIRALRNFALGATLGLAVSAAATSSASAVTITSGVESRNKKTDIESEYEVKRPSIVTGTCLSGSCIPLVSESQINPSDFWSSLLSGKDKNEIKTSNGDGSPHHVVSGGKDSEEESQQNSENLFDSLNDDKDSHHEIEISSENNDDGQSENEDNHSGSNPSAVPVPGAMPMLLTGLIGVGILGRRRKRVL